MREQDIPKSALNHLAEARRELSENGNGPEILEVIMSLDWVIYRVKSLLKEDESKGDMG